MNVRLSNKVDRVLRAWGITEIPFSEKVVAEQKNSRLRQIFTGREADLGDALLLLRSAERRRLLVCGWLGIGKSAFILRLLDELKQREPRALIAYISLPEKTDLVTCALVALARELKNHRWARQLLTGMGLSAGAWTSSFSGQLGLPHARAGVRVEREPAVAPQYPAVCFEEILRGALKHHSRVVIAIDDLDKRDPAHIRELLQNAQGMLSGRASFILTGPPAGLTLQARALGLFDLSIHLEPLELAEMRDMLAKYLNSVRCRRSPSRNRTFYPFVDEAATLLCERSEGVPRYFNKFGTYAMLWAFKVRAELIDRQVFEDGLSYGSKLALGAPQLTAQERCVLDLVIQRGVLSDDKIRLDDLKRLDFREFNEVLPILESLFQQDLVRRLPSDHATRFGLSPLVRPFKIVISSAKELGGQRQELDQLLRAILRGHSWPTAWSIVWMPDDAEPTESNLATVRDSDVFVAAFGVKGGVGPAVERECSEAIKTKRVVLVFAQTMADGVNPPSDVAAMLSRLNLKPELFKDPAEFMVLVAEALATRLRDFWSRLN